MFAIRSCQFFQRKKITSIVVRTFKLKPCNIQQFLENKSCQPVTVLFVWMFVAGVDEVVFFLGLVPFISTSCYSEEQPVHFLGCAERNAGNCILIQGAVRLKDPTQLCFLTDASGEIPSETHKSIRNTVRYLESIWLLKNGYQLICHCLTGSVSTLTDPNRVSQLYGTEQSSRRIKRTHLCLYSPIFDPEVPSLY